MSRLQAKAVTFLRTALPILLLAAGISHPATILAQVSLASDGDSARNIIAEKGSSIWIEGSAGIVDYTCRTRELDSTGAITYNPHSRRKAGEEGARAGGITVSIPVRSLECGKRAMNRDMYEALKAEAHPYIRYRLLKAEAGDSLRAGTFGNGIPIRTSGILEIAGVTDTTEVVVKGQMLEENRFRVRGSRELRMDTFDITPPSALMGLIRAENRLTVHFDVTVSLRAE